MNNPAETEPGLSTHAEAVMGLNPETQFLLLCGRCGTSQDHRELSRLLEGSLDWDHIYTAASHHGLLPLVHWNLSQCPPDEVPDHVLAEFRREFEENSARSFYLTASLNEVFQHLLLRKIRAAAYKGPALAQVAYGNLLLRPYCDLDILLDQSAMSALRSALEEIGFEKKFHSDRESNEYAHSFVRQSTQGGWVVIEAHWAITPRHFSLPSDIKGMWQRLREVELAGQTILALGTADHLLALCWHGYKHRWSRLEWIVCIAEMIRRSESETATPIEQVDWRFLMHAARESGSTRILLTGLRLAHDVLHAPVPREVVELSRKDRVLKALLPVLLDELLRQSEHEGNSLKSPRFFHLQSRERWRDKISYVGKLVTTPGQIDWSLLTPWRTATR